MSSKHSNMILSGKAFGRIWACRHRMRTIFGGVGPFQARFRSVGLGQGQCKPPPSPSPTAPSGRAFQTPHAIAAAKQLVILWAGMMLALPIQGQIRLRAELRLMGSDFVLTAVGTDSMEVQAAITAGISEIERIEGVISSWLPGSETSRINAAAGIKPVMVSQELRDLIQRSLKISALTDGAFDLGFGPLAQCWPLRDTAFAWPDSQTVDSLKSLVDYRKIQVNPEMGTVFLPQAGMCMGFGAIGKGYAANRARAVMQSYKLKGGMVNAGGDLCCWGQDLGETAWEIGISNPQQPEQAHTRLHIDNLAVVTSGDYINYIWHEGQRYSHIIDPRSGYPVLNMASVTVICPDAELADALATAVSVMGIPEGLDLLEQLRGIEGIILTGDGRTFETSGISSLK